MAEFASAILGPVIESLIVPVKKHMGYLFSSTEHVRKMSDRMKKQLEGKFNDVKNHKEENDRNTRETPDRVPDWLEEVTKIKSDVETISSNENGCFNINARYQRGRNAWKTTQKIVGLLQEERDFGWRDALKPLAKVDSRKASTSAPSTGHGIGEVFNSRDTTFKDASKLLQQDQKTQLIALCGMGGVGKTTMMKQLKKDMEDKKMFDWIVKVDIRKQPNWHSIQKAVAENLGNPLTEEIETTRADRLHKRFEEILKNSQKGILVILDDVWNRIELGDLGLSPLPNGVKLLLTSRDEHICKQIAVEDNLDFKVLPVNVLEQTEAHKFFCQITKISAESDPERYEIGGDIVKKCSCLPLAIKLIAATVISEERSIWEDTLRRLRNNDLDQNVHEIIKISYDYLKEQEYKEIFLLCGLFPEDSNIPMEDLTRYAWGLKLLNGVSTVEEGRNRTKTCVSNLRKANLLIDGDHRGCVKMHDLVLAFVLATISEGDHASIVNHGDISNMSTDNMRESCKRISLTCTGMSEFPRNFKFPNLSLLKLMHGDESLKFPEDFYQGMEKLQVIAYDIMKYPLLSRSLDCSTNLRTLCLSQCSLMFDCSSIGNLSNLEVLSFAHCGLRKLPSTIGNLKELKLLDLTGCLDLIIDDGVLKNLIKLEELYVKVGTTGGFKNNKKAIRFSDSICNELSGLSKNLFALEIEFFDNNALPKNMSFKKLERFKISLGRFLNDDDGKNRHLYENTLMLVTNKLLDSGMKELFEKTEVLHLQVNDVNDLGDGLTLHHQRSSFYKLRVLEICKCENLRYLFTVGVANGLTKLERLTVSSCPVLKTLIDGGVGVIKFQALKFLSLSELPKLMSLCNVVNVIELPQLEELILDGLPNITSIYQDHKSATSSLSNDISTMQPFLNKEVVIPELKKLKIFGMERMKEIWPSNPMSLLHHLEELEVCNCGSIKVLFNIDLGCKIEESSCSLRRIEVKGCNNLREVWRIKGGNNSGLLISGFEAVESLKIWNCERFRNVFTPTTTNFDMRALSNLTINFIGGRQEQEINEEISEEVGDDISNVIFSSHLIHTTFHHLRTLEITNHKRAEVVFEVENPHNNQQPLLLPYLNELRLRRMECMSHVWKCNWNIPQNQQSFHNLTTISLERCENIKYLFSPLMAKLLSNLKDIYISTCDVIEEVVSNRDDEDEELVASTSTNISISFFPHLDILRLLRLPNLKSIGGGSTKISSTTPIHHQSKEVAQVNDVSWSLCQYFRKISIFNCEALPYVIPSYALEQMQKLEELEVYSCGSLVEVFETQGSGGNDATMVIQIMKKIIVPQLSNLKKLTIESCRLLEHVLTFSTLESLTQLESLKIRNCEAMKVIVKEDNEEQTTISYKVVVFPHLKSLTLDSLPSLKGFYLGKEGFSWPSLDTLDIKECPAIRVFTMGHLTTPELKVIGTSFGRCELVREQDLNSFINTQLKEGLKLGQDEDEDEMGAEDEERVDKESESRVDKESESRKEQGE